MAQHATTDPPAEPGMTLGQWADLDEDVPGELVDGRLVEEEEAGALHDAIVAFLVGVLTQWLGPRGVVLVSDTRFGVSPHRGRKPDTSVYLRGRSPPPTAW
jgi:Uma2 family endonuclease